jgi:hypothetical protein
MTEPPEIPTSLDEPELDPPDRVLMVITNFGPEGGGWGPAAFLSTLTGMSGPFVYTSDKTHVLAAAHQLAKQIAAAGQEARVCRFTEREDLGVYGGEET